MRWIGVLGLGVLSIACVRENPAFEGSRVGDTDTTPAETEGPMDSAASTTTSGEGSTGDSGSDSDDPGGTGSEGGDVDAYICGEERFLIDVQPQPSECSPFGGIPIPIATVPGCYQLTVDGSGILDASEAQGCGQGVCQPLDGGLLEVDVRGVDLTGVVDDGTTCAQLGLFGYSDGKVCTRWEGVAIWDPDGRLKLVVANGLPEGDAPRLLIRPQGDPVEVTSAFTADSWCGDVSDSCEDPGWRKIEFGTNEAAAYPDAVPAEVWLGDQELRVINYGLQIDRHCDQHGRWAVVPADREWMLD